MKQYRFTIAIVTSFRWDDDVVFKNCAKGIPEKGKVGTKMLTKTLGTVWQMNVYNFCAIVVVTRSYSNI